MTTLLTKEEMNKHIEALEVVKATGKINILASAKVIGLLMDMGYCDTFDYLVSYDGRVNRQRYMELVRKIEN